MFRLQNNESPQPLLHYYNARGNRKYSFCHLFITITFINSIILIVLTLYMFSLVNDVHEKINDPNTTEYIKKIGHMINNACVMIPGICDP